MFHYVISYRYLLSCIKTGFFSLLFLFLSTSAFAANRPPEPVTSEYFKTSSAGLVLDLKRREFRYVLGLEILKPFSAPVVAQVEFEDPRDPDNPLIVLAEIDPGEEKLSVKSPAVSSPQKDKYYKIDVSVFKRPDKKELVARHSQKILSVVNEESIDIVSRLNGLKRWINSDHRLEVSYPAGWHVKEMSSGNNFQAFFSLENIDLEGYYSTGIMLLRHINPGLQMSGLSTDHEIINNIVSDTKNLISEERKTVITERGYEGVVSKINFVNYKGVEEKELLAVFSHERRLAVLLCESPSGDFDKYEKTFYSIIMTAQLY